MQISISEELLDAIVNALTQLPYREVQPVFDRLSAELMPSEEPEPQIIV